MDQFDAMFGVGSGLGEDSQPMIDALRMQKRGGDIASLSTIGQVSDMGKREVAQSVAAGKRAGGLKQTRELEQRRKEDEQSRFTRDSALAKTVAQTANANRVKAAETLRGNQVSDNELKAKVDAGKTAFTQGKRTATPFWHPTEKNKILNYERDSQGNYVDEFNNPVTIEGLTPYNTGSTASAQALASPKLNPKTVPAIGPDGQRVKVLEGRDNGLLYDEKTRKPLDGFTRAKPYKPATPKEAETLRGQVEQIGNLEGLVDSFDPAFANSSGIPLFGTAQNWTANNVPVMASPAMKAQAAWWRNWNKFFDMAEKHDQLGSQQTRIELKNWMQNNANADATPEQTQKFLDLTKKLVEQEKEGILSSQANLNRDPKHTQDATKIWRDDDVGDAFKQSVKVDVITDDIDPSTIEGFAELPVEDQALLMSGYTQGGD